MTEQEQRENELLIALCREAGDRKEDSDIIKGARSNHSPDDIRKAASGDVVALIRLRLAIGLPIF